MKKQTATFIPPTLCGCQIQLTAEFTDGSVINGITYRHPKPFSITKIAIVNVCNKHKPNTLSLPDTSWFFSKPAPNSYSANLAEKYPNVASATVQTRGYLKYPITDPTPAECLYTFLSQLGGQKHSYPCGCSAHQWVDQNGKATYIAPHPLNTNKCIFHANDTIDMKQAAADFKTLQSTVASSVKNNKSKK